MTKAWYQTSDILEQKINYREINQKKIAQDVYGMNNAFLEVEFKNFCLNLKKVFEQKKKRISKAFMVRVAVNYNHTEYSNYRDI